MKIKIELNNEEFHVDLNKGTSIAIPFSTSDNHVNAWYVPPIKKEPAKIGDWIGSVEAGASVNFFNLTFNPHGNGTHTECLGHITKEHESLKDLDIDHHFICEVISVKGRKKGEDVIITKEEIESKIQDKSVDALIIRTLPNDDSKTTRQYSNSNPPFISEQAAEYIKSIDIKHILIDTPSVDKEKDDGQLIAHHAFWNMRGERRELCTITEMIYVPCSIEDGKYLLNLQFLPIENDASPSNPVLYPLM